MANAGWYPDPDGTGGQRYFDGTNWGPVAPPSAGAPADTPLTAAAPRKNGQGRKVAALVVGALVLMFAFAQCSGNDDDNKSDSKSSSSSTARTTYSAPPTPTSTEPPKPEADFTGDPTGAMTASFDIPQNLTEGLTKDSGRYKTIEVLEYSKKTYPGASQVNIVGSYPLTDAYGNTATKVAINLVYSRSTLDKINFAGVDKDKIWELADSGFVVPAFQP